ncbi:MAG: flavin reductase family protein [Myxococcales bacterium]|nr:flavin reductase family protein [Myxococcales bacterium]MDH3483131.1 flavin reductase family protein [Myxococcales bacterium]
MPIDHERFREVLRNWASGVTVVTTRAGDKIHGMTVSAFSSVSANPPLVLVCANQASTTHGVIEQGGLFTVNILAAHQADISDVFASPANEDTRLLSVRWSVGETGAPLIDEALACLECKVTSAHQEGSHTIYVGQVEAVHTTDAEPLLYYRGRYRALHNDD